MLLLLLLLACISLSNWGLLFKMSEYLSASIAFSSQMTLKRSRSLMCGTTRTVVFWLCGRFTCTRIVTSKGLCALCVSGESACTLDDTRMDTGLLAFEMYAVGFSVDDFGIILMRCGSEKC